MPFNSVAYFLFLPPVYLLFYLAPDRTRWLVLLGASLLFYAALELPYLPAVLFLVAVTSYGFGIALDRTGAPRARTRVLWGGIAANVAILAALKYLPLLQQGVAPPLSRAPQPEATGLVAAIGVSYYVFQAISYLVDIYLELERSERHFGYFMLYLAFFPKLLQGPIERAGHLMPQLKASYRLDYDNIRSGLLLFAWGLYKKLVLADRLDRYVDPVFADVGSYSGLPLLVAIYAYAFQIYFDFSAYTDMALGSARLFNIKLTQNFDSPYLATSVADFWRRWHMSFANWLRDYLFRPLQLQWRDWNGWGSAAALLLAFLLSGLWHGASWGFLAWGGLHGLYMAGSTLYRPYQRKLHRALGVTDSTPLRVWRIFVTFNLVSFAWVFFRAHSLPDALLVFDRVLLPWAPFPPGAGLPALVKGILGALGCTLVQFGILLLNLGIFLLVSRYRPWERFHGSAGPGTLSRWSFYLFLMTLTICFATVEYSPFLYFQF